MELFIQIEPYLIGKQIMMLTPLTQDYTTIFKLFLRAVKPYLNIIAIQKKKKEKQAGAELCQAQNQLG